MKLYIESKSINRLIILIIKQILDNILIVYFFGEKKIIFIWWEFSIYS